MNVNFEPIILRLLIKVFLKAIILTRNQTMTSEVESCGPESTYAYADFKMNSTLVTDFDMVCDQAKEVDSGIQADIWSLSLRSGCR